jgi:hypothetical protein
MNKSRKPVARKMAHPDDGTLRTPKKRARPGSRAAQQETTAARQARFLKAYATAGTVRSACALARVGRRTHYTWLEHDETYQAWFREAQDDVADKLEQEAMRRAHDGVRKPVYQGGKRVGFIQEYSDVLLIFLLKGLRPEKYRERFEHSGTGKGGAIPMELQVKVALLDGGRELNAKRDLPYRHYGADYTGPPETNRSS